MMGCKDNSKVSFHACFISWLFGLISGLAREIKQQQTNQLIETAGIGSLVKFIL